MKNDTLFYIQQCFEASGLFYEFIETLVNDTEIKEVVRRKIWSLASTLQNGKEREQACVDIAAAFEDSEDALDLQERWRKVLDTHWPRLHDCPLKQELDALEDK